MNGWHDYLRRVSPEIFEGLTDDEIDDLVRATVKKIRDHRARRTNEEVANASWKALTRPDD